MRQPKSGLYKNKKSCIAATLLLLVGKTRFEFFAETLAGAMFQK
jgi:hypothetical protein